MAKQRLNQDEAFKSIMGINTEESKETGKTEESEAAAGGEIFNKKSKPKSKEKLVPTAFYITEKQRKALKIKTAVGTKPEDKDLSSIVRAALDIYLADELKNF